MKNSSGGGRSVAETPPRILPYWSSNGTNCGTRDVSQMSFLTDHQRSQLMHLRVVIPRTGRGTVHLIPSSAPTRTTTTTTTTRTTTGSPKATPPNKKQRADDDQPGSASAAASHRSPENASVKSKIVTGIMGDTEGSLSLASTMERQKRKRKRNNSKKEGMLEQLKLIKELRCRLEKSAAEAEDYRDEYIKAHQKKRSSKQKEQQTSQSHRQEEKTSSPKDETKVGEDRFQEDPRSLATRLLVQHKRDAMRLVALTEAVRGNYILQSYDYYFEQCAQTQQQQQQQPQQPSNAAQVQQRSDAGDSEESSQQEASCARSNLGQNQQQLHNNLEERPTSRMSLERANKLVEQHMDKMVADEEARQRHASGAPTLFHESHSSLTSSARETEANQMKNRQRVRPLLSRTAPQEHSSIVSSQARSESEIADAAAMPPPLSMTHGASGPRTFFSMTWTPSTDSQASVGSQTALPTSSLSTDASTAQAENSSARNKSNSSNVVASPNVNKRKATQMHAQRQQEQQQSTESKTGLDGSSGKDDESLSVAKKGQLKASVTDGSGNEKITQTALTQKPNDSAVADSASMASSSAKQSYKTSSPNDQDTASAVRKKPEKPAVAMDKKSSKQSADSASMSSSSTKPSSTKGNDVGSAVIEKPQNPTIAKDTKTSKESADSSAMVSLSTKLSPASSPTNDKDIESGLTKKPQNPAILMDKTSRKPSADSATMVSPSTKLLQTSPSTNGKDIENAVRKKPQNPTTVKDKTISKPSVDSATIVSSSTKLSQTSPSTNGKDIESASTKKPQNPTIVMDKTISKPSANSATVVSSSKKLSPASSSTNTNVGNPQVDKRELTSVADKIVGSLPTSKVEGEAKINRNDSSPAEKSISFDRRNEEQASDRPPARTLATATPNTVSTNDAKTKYEGTIPVVDRSSSKQTSSANLDNSRAIASTKSSVLSCQSPSSPSTSKAEKNVVSSLERHIDSPNQKKIAKAVIGDGLKDAASTGMMRTATNMIAVSPITGRKPSASSHRAGSDAKDERTLADNNFALRTQANGPLRNTSTEDHMANAAAKKDDESDQSVVSILPTPLNRVVHMAVAAVKARIAAPSNFMPGIFSEAKKNQPKRSPRDTGQQPQSRDNSTPSPKSDQK